MLVVTDHRRRRVSQAQQCSSQGCGSLPKPYIALILDHFQLHAVHLHRLGSASGHTRCGTCRHPHLDHRRSVLRHVGTRQPFHRFQRPREEVRPNAFHLFALGHACDRVELVSSEEEKNGRDPKRSDEVHHCRKMRLARRRQAAFELINNGTRRTGSGCKLVLQHTESTSCAA